MDMKEFLAELNEIESTEAEIAERKSKMESNRAAIVEEIKMLVSGLNIAPSELFAADALSSKQRKTRGPVLVKYRSPTGDEWSGRGLTPRWLNDMIAQGRAKEEFAVAQ
jgi:DNA-binding protein H-NS